GWLGPEACIVPTRQAAARMLQRLPEWRAAVAEIAQAWANIEVGVEIDAADGCAGRDIAEKMTIGGLVAAAEHNRHGAGSENGRDHFRKRGLAVLQGAADADIPGVEGNRNRQVHMVWRVPGRQTIE